MRHLVAIAITLALGQAAAADYKSDYDAALAKWEAAGVRSYAFTYQWHGAVVIAPACADAIIRVRVKNGAAGDPTVVRGNSRCPRGTRGARAIGLPVPATIDDAFREMRRYIVSPPTAVRITAEYDETYGIPKTYFVEKLEIEDNDEGFRITSFEVAK